MSEEPGTGAKTPSRMSGKIFTMVTTAVATAVVFVLVMVVILSPAMSPLASAHDADGDGFADSADEFPDDGSEWSDLAGDGKVDAGDYVRLTANSFAYETTYTFTVVYEPNYGLMAECSFLG